MNVTSTNEIPGYRGLHNWVAKQLGKPMRCEKCGTTEKRRYEWSNKSGEYRRELDDWERLCKPCHTRKDRGWSRWNEEFCKNGHRMTLDNIFLYKKRNNLACRKCRKIQRQRYIEKMRTVTNPKTIGGEAE